jgi:hypothetical protein
MVVAFISVPACAAFNDYTMGGAPDDFFEDLLRQQRITRSADLLIDGQVCDIKIFSAQNRSRKKSRKSSKRCGLRLPKHFPNKGK